MQQQALLPFFSPSRNALPFPPPSLAFLLPSHYPKTIPLICGISYHGRWGGGSSRMLRPNRSVRALSGAANMLYSIFAMLLGSNTEWSLVKRPIGLGPEWHNKIVATDETDSNPFPLLYRASWILELANFIWTVSLYCSTVSNGKLLCTIARVKSNVI